MTDGDEPVYGCTHGAVVDEKLKGLTKREHFMGLAMQACIIADSILNNASPQMAAKGEDMAAKAASLADAHIAQLSKVAEPVVPDPVEPPVDDPIASE